LANQPDLPRGGQDSGSLPTDLASLTYDLASSFRSACEKAGLTLTIDTPALPEPVFVDQEMWEKIVLNLVSNAFKFTLSLDLPELLVARMANELPRRVCTHITLKSGWVISIKLPSGRTME
jgi:signal transduction histidine kinase